MARERGTGIYTKTRFGGGHEVTTYGGSVYLMGASKRNQHLLRAETREMTFIDSQHHFSLRNNYSQRLAMTHDLLRLQDDLRKVKYLDGDVRGKPKNQWDDRLKHRPAARRGERNSETSRLTGSDSLPDIGGGNNRQVGFRMAAEGYTMEAKDHKGLSGLRMALNSERFKSATVENTQTANLKGTVSDFEGVLRQKGKVQEVDTGTVTEKQHEQLEFKTGEKIENEGKVSELSTAAEDDGCPTASGAQSGAGKGKGASVKAARNGEQWAKFKTTPGYKTWWEELKTVVETDNHLTVPNSDTNSNEQKADQQVTTNTNDQPTQKDFLPFIDMRRAHSLINIRKLNRSKEEHHAKSSSANTALRQHARESTMTALSQRLSLRRHHSGQQLLANFGSHKSHRSVDPAGEGSAPTDTDTGIHLPVLTAVRELKKDVSAEGGI